MKNYTNETDIIRDDNLTTAQKNAALKDCGVKSYHMEDTKNVITKAEKAATHVGKTAKETNGWGYFHTGDFAVKVKVVNGVIQGGAGGEPEKDYIEIGGKKYKVDGDRLVD